MSRLNRLKRRVLRQAVQENVDLIEGRFRRRRPRRRSGPLLRSLAFVGLPAAVVAGYLLVTLSGSRSPARADDPGAAAPPAADAALASSSLPEGLVPDGLQLPTTAPKPLSRGVFPLPVRKIVLDPGHGGANLGSLAPGGLMEKELTLDVGLRLEKLLAGYGFEVELTRRTDESVSLEERAEFANLERADIFVSIHVNWIDARQTRGIETYYLGPTDDPYVTELAAQENQGSGYSLADFRLLLERVYADARQGESRLLASEVQRSLHGALRRISPDLQNRGVKRAPFAVLTGTEMPAILAEVSCLSNEEEARLLKLPEYRQYISEALAQGIRSYSLQLTGGSTQRGS